MSSRLLESAELESQLGFELGRHELFALRRLISKLKLLYITGVLNCYASRNLASGRNMQLEGYSAGKFISSDAPI